MDGILAVLSMFVVLIVVLYGAYFTTRFLGTRLGSGFAMQGDKLSVVHRLSLGREQQLLVVKVANRHILLGCTTTQVTFITELSPEESQDICLQKPQRESPNVPSFAQIMLGLRDKKENEDTKD
ncbi:MAG: flagellar biosynthetic protein FliO [Eubacteriales bacterium]